MHDTALDPLKLIRPGRQIWGASAILLPFDSRGAVDWDGFRAHLGRTAECGLTPAVNMDTGYVNLLDDGTRNQVLKETKALLGGQPFISGAFVADQSGARFDLDAYRRAIDPIVKAGGLPILFPSFGLTGQGDGAILDSYRALSTTCERFLAFELGTMFAPFGKIFSLEVFGELLKMPQCVGLKHSSLNRNLEWQRIALRDRVRPEFRLCTGNDLAIDMVMYGSDYLLGLSTMAPDLFAKRDAMWETGDSGFYELNDALQYLGNFTFRAPTSAYKHSAAMFLKLRGWIGCDAPHLQGVRRPESDVAVLEEIAARLGIA